MFQPQCGGYSRLLSAKPGRWSNQVPIPGTDGGRTSSRLNSFTSKKPIPQARMKPLEPVSLIRTTVQGMSMPQWKWSLADFPLVLKAVNSLNLELPKNWKYFPQLQRKTDVIESVSQQPKQEEINVTEQPHTRVKTKGEDVVSNTMSREGRIRLIREQLEDVPVAREEHDFERAMTESDASVKWFYSQSGTQTKGATVTEKRVSVVNKKSGPASGKEASQTWQQLPNVLQKTSKYLPSFSKAKEVPSVEVKKAETLKKNLIAKRRETGIAQIAVKRKTRSLVASLRAAEMTSSKLLRLEELCRHLVEHPESTTIAIKERLVPCLLSLKKTKDRVLQEQVHEAMALIGYVSPVPTRGTRVLSMDGGGTRGLMTLQTLLKFQEATGKEPYQLFDYIIGVSTGALLAAMVGVFRVPLKECIQLYKDFSSEMFTRSRLSGAKQLVTSHAYYDSKMWENILRDQFGEVTFVSTARDKKCPKDYEKARTKAKRAVNRGFSEMSSTDDNSKRKRVPAKKLCHSEEEEQPTPTEGETSKNLETSQDPPLSCSDSSDDIEDEPAVKKTKRVKKHHTLPPPPPVRPFPIASTSRTSEGPDLVGTKDMLPASQSQASTSSRDLKLFTLLEEIKGQVRQNSALLKGLLNKQHSALAPEQGMDLFTLPLRTEADVANMEDLLRDKNNQTTLIAMVSTLMNQLTIQNFLFRNYNLPPRVQSVYPGSCQDKLWQGIRASSAAPGYYEELKINDKIHQDGGLLTNNPTAIALHECKLLWPNEQFSCIVSIGTGRYEPAVDKMDQSYSSLKTKLNKFVQSATDTEAVHNLLHDLLPPKTYYRFNPYMSENFELDEVNPSKWLVMEHDSQMYLRKNEHKIQAVAKQLSLPRRVDQKAKDWIKQQSDLHTSK